MRIHGIGIDIPDTQVDGSRRVLVGELERAQSLGFTLAELSIPSLSVIMRMAIWYPAARRAQFGRRSRPSTCDIRFTRRGGATWHLAGTPSWNIACLKPACASPARLARAYPGVSQRIAGIGCCRVRERIHCRSDEELARGAEREVAALRQTGADCGRFAGVIIGMENGDPHLWEYAAFEASRVKAPDRASRLSMRGCGHRRWSPRPRPSITPTCRHHAGFGSPVFGDSGCTGRRLLWRRFRRRRPGCVICISTTTSASWTCGVTITRAIACLMAKPTCTCRRVGGRFPLPRPLRAWMRLRGRYRFGDQIERYRDHLDEALANTQADLCLTMDRNLVNTCLRRSDEAAQFMQRCD